MSAESQFNEQTCLFWFKTFTVEVHSTDNPLCAEKHKSLCNKTLICRGAYLFYSLDKPWKEMRKSKTKDQQTVLSYHHYVPSAHSLKGTRWVLLLLLLDTSQVIWLTAIQITQSNTIRLELHCSCRGASSASMCCTSSSSSMPQSKRKKEKQPSCRITNKSSERRAHVAHDAQLLVQSAETNLIKTLQIKMAKSWNCIIIIISQK